MQNLLEFKRKPNYLIDIRGGFRVIFRLKYAREERGKLRSNKWSVIVYVIKVET